MTDLLRGKVVDPLRTLRAGSGSKRAYASSSQNMKGEPEVTVERLGPTGGVALLTLNAPERLNALSMGMLKSMNEALDEHFAPPSAAEKGEARLLVVRGTGGKGFCAGGDVKAVARSESLGPGVPGTLRSDSFREAYILDYRLALIAVKKESLAVWDGVVMGAGVGISVHASYRVATEKAMFAMPETVIGLLPDVGASYVLSRLPGGLGQYIGLTGARLNADDLLHCGIATHMVPRDRLEDLQQALSSGDGRDTVTILNKFCAGGSPGQSMLAKNRVWIDEAFRGSPSVEEIVRRLEARAAGEGPANRVVGGLPEDAKESGQEWARSTLAALRRASPTALKVTHRHISLAAGKDIRWCYEHDFRVVQHLMSVTDFGEGVRALLIDKDNKPAWRPPTLEGLTGSMLERFFKPIGEHELDLSSVK